MTSCLSLALSLSLSLSRSLALALSLSLSLDLSPPAQSIEPRRVRKVKRKPGETEGGTPTHDGMSKGS